MRVLAQLESLPKPGNRRGATRRRLNLALTLRGSGVDVVIHDLSETGLLIQTQSDLALDETLEVALEYAGVRQAKIAWNSGQFYGCQFADKIPAAAVSAALLRSPTTLPGSEIERSLPDRTAEAIGITNELSLAMRLGIIVALAFGSWALIGMFIWLL